MASVEIARNAAGRHAWRETYEAYANAGGADLLPTISSATRTRPGGRGGSTRRSPCASARMRRSAPRGEAAVPRGSPHPVLGSPESRGFAISRGWFANAERQLDGLPETAEHGYLSLSRGITLLLSQGDVPNALEELGRAHEIARRTRDRDTQVLALVGQGRAYVQAGDVEKGLAILDEASTSAVSGELRPFATGLVYCVTIRPARTSAIPAGRRVDRGREPLVRRGGHERLPRRVPRPPRRDPPPER